MEPEQQIAQACKILGKTEPAVKRRVAYAISTVAMRKVVKKPGARYGATLTGRQKEAAENLASALRRLLNALPDKTIPNRKSNNLALNLKRGPNSPFMDDEHCRKFFEDWHERAQRATRTKFDSKDNAKSWPKLEAAKFALRLLQAQDLHPSISKLKSKRTPFQRLAAILHGTPDTVIPSSLSTRAERGPERPLRSLSFKSAKIPYLHPRNAREPVAPLLQMMETRGTRTTVKLHPVRWRRICNAAPKT